jgi:hypothetical protein
LERQLAIFLGPHPFQEDLHNLTFSFVNVMTQPTRGEPLSPTYLAQDASTASHSAYETPRRPSTATSCGVCALLPRTASSSRWWTTSWNRPTTSSRRTRSRSPTLVQAAGATTPHASASWRM